MSQLIFLSVPPKSKVPVKASLYKCPNTHASVLANEIMIPLSPYTGKVMERTTARRIEVEASDVKDSELKVVGTCKNCQHTLLASDKAISSLANTKPHCVICGTEIAPAGSTRVEQLIKQALPEDYDLDEGSDLHDIEDMDNGNPEFDEIGLNEELLDPGHDQRVAQEILSAMNDEEDEDSDDEDSDDEDSDDSDDDDYDYDNDDDSDEDEDAEEDSDDDSDDYDEDEDSDDGDLGENDYSDDDGDGEEPTDDDSDDSEYGDDEGDDEEPQVNPSDDDDDTMDAQAAMWNADEDDADDNDAPRTVGEMDMTTMDPDLTVKNSGLRQVGINASDALHSVISSENATLAVLPIDNTSAMILAMVEDVGYMPYIALEASKASEAVKPLFANPAKLVETVNAVLANSQDDLVKDLASFGVRQITYSVKASSLIEKRIKEGVSAATSALKDEKAHIVDDMRQCLAISATHVLKNLSDDATNAVSAALSESLKKVGVRSANTLVDEAFTQHGPELMKTIIAKALDLMNKPYDTRNEIAKYVTAATGRNVLATASIGDRVAKSLADGTVPLSTVQTPAGNTVESADAASGIPVSASTNVDYSSIVRQAASRRFVKATR